MKHTQKTNDLLLNKLEEVNDLLLNIYPEVVTSQQEELNELLLDKLEELKELEFIDLVLNKRSITELIEIYIKCGTEELESIDSLIENLIYLFAYKREIYRRTGE